MRCLTVRRADFNNGLFLINYGYYNQLIEKGRDYKFISEFTDTYENAIKYVEKTYNTTIIKEE